MAKAKRHHNSDRARLIEHQITVPGRVLKVIAYSSVDALLDQCIDADDIPFWAEIWPASRGLAYYLWLRRLDGLTILELGAGVGVGGIAAALRGGYVLQTDYVRRALALARINARLNGTRQVRWRLGDWRNFPDVGRFDLILGADILYEPSLHSHLRAIMHRHLKKGGMVLLADPGRLAAENFVVAREREGWAWSLEEVILPDGEVINIICLSPSGAIGFDSLGG